MKFRIGRAVKSMLAGTGMLAVAAATLTTTVGNASASTPPSYSWDHIYKVPGATVYVKEHGDVISVCDTKANGYSAFVEVYAGLWPYSYRLTHGGYPTCATRSASDGGNYNLPEGKYVSLAIGGDSLTYSAEFTFLNDH